MCLDVHTIHTSYVRIMLYQPISHVIVCEYLIHFFFSIFLCFLLHCYCNSLKFRFYFYSFFLFFSQLFAFVADIVVVVCVFVVSIDLYVGLLLLFHLSLWLIQTCGIYLHKYTVYCYVCILPQQQQQQKETYKRIIRTTTM